MKLFYSSLLVALLAVCLCACSDRMSLPIKSVNPSKYIIGAMAPDLELVNAKGEFSRLSDYRGKLVFLNFWASWCVICRHELPQIERLQEWVDSGNFVVLAVSLDENKQSFLNVCQKSAGGLELWHDYKGQAKGLFNPGMLPVSMLISRAGQIVSFADPETGHIEQQFSGPKNWANPATLEMFKLLAKSSV